MAWVFPSWWCLAYERSVLSGEDISELVHTCRREASFAGGGGLERGPGLASDRSNTDCGRITKADDMGLVEEGCHGTAQLRCLFGRADLLACFKGDHRDECGQSNCLITYVGTVVWCLVNYDV